VMIRTGVWGVSSIIGSDSGYTSIGDLKDKTIALPFPGAPLDVQMRYIFEKNGIDPDNDLRIVYTPFPQAAGQIISGQVDAAPLPEPLATTVVAGKGLVRYVRVQDAWADVQSGDPLSPQVALFTTTESLSEVNSILPVLLSEWQETSDYVTEFPQQASDAHAEELGFPAGVVKTAIGNTIYRVTDSEDNKNRVLNYLTLIYDGTDRNLPKDSFFADF